MKARGGRLRRFRLVILAVGLLVGGSVFSLQALAGPLSRALTNRDAAYVPASISGTITDPSGNAITTQDICVTAYSSDGGNGYETAITDASGNYVITGLVPDSYDVQASDCPGSSRNDAPTLYGTQAGGTAVTVTGGQTQAAVNIKMDAGASISGTITDASGNPITSGDICVEASSYTASTYGYGEATSGSSGTYTITQLPAGGYTIYAYDCSGNRNDLPTYYGQSTSNPYGTTLTLTAGQAQTSADIQMQAATSISGHVYGGSGTLTPLSNACVTVRDAANHNWQGATRTAADGSYTVSQLTPGVPDTVEFTQCGAGSNWLPSYYAGASSLAGATSVTPTVASPSTGIDGHLAAGGAISGQITDAAGKPIVSQDVCISAGLSTGGFTRYSTTDATGDYTVSGLQTGSYYVKAYDCRTHMTRDDLPTYYTTSAGGQRTAVAVTAGTTTASISVQMLAGTSISGQVYGGSGTSNPLSDACVYVWPTTSGGSRGSAMTAADGSYSVIRLVPGVAYDVEFDPCYGNSQYTPEYYNGASTQSSATTVTPTVAAPATAINGHLPVGATITGTVKDANGTPITTQDICLTASSSDGGDGFGSATSTASGSYTITGLPADSYDVYAADCYASNRNDVPTYYSASSGGAPTAVTTTAGQTVSSIDIQMQPATSISGHVYAGSGSATPVGNACVTAYAGSPGTPAGAATTAPDGSYTITGLTAGVGYKVEFDPCSAGSVYAIQYYNDQSSLASADVITPSATNPSTGIDAHLTGGASISGTVTDANGNPITTQDVCVQASPSSGGGYGLAGGQATTDATGDYEITGLSAGSYYVEFSDCSASARNDVSQYYGNAPDASNSSLVVLSSGGAQAGVNAKMQSGTTISGHAYAGSGTASPLTNICVYVAARSATGSGNYYPFYYGETGSNGAYSVDHIAQTTSGYTVQFTDCNSPVHYVSQYYGGTFESGTATAVVPTVSTPATAIDAHLDYGGAISGTVTDSSGAPITSGVCVDAQMSGSSYYSGYGDTLTSGGGYTIGGLPTGSYDVSFSDCGTRNDVPQTLANPVSVTVGQTTTGADATMAPATSISGHVYGGAGTATPLSDVCVQALDPTSGAWVAGAEAYTAADGSYTIEHLPPGGSYAVEFNSCPYGAAAGYAMQYYDGVSALNQAAALTPTLATPSTGIDAHLPNGAPVTTITGGPAANAQTTQTDAAFSFVANQSGVTFECALDGGAYAPCTSPYDTGTLTSGPHTFSVRATAGASGLTEVSPPYVQWTVNPSSPTSTSQGEVTAGGTFNSDPGGQTSTTTPVIVGVTPPDASQVTLTAEPTTTTSGNGYTIFGQQVDIAVTQPGGGSPVTGTASDPIQLDFTLDQSQIPANTAISDITLTRNGSPAADCAAQDGTASPDPCVASRTKLADGSVQLVVLTTHASTWNFATTSGTVAAPVSESAPGAPAGTAQQGQTLTADSGSWSNGPTGYAYQWEDCDRSGAGCSQIGGATSRTYQLVLGDVGHTIRVLVTASNAGGNSSAAPSAATGVVQGASSGGGTSGGGTSGGGTSGGGGGTSGGGGTTNGGPSGGGGGTSGGGGTTNGGGTPPAAAGSTTSSPGSPPAANPGPAGPGAPKVGRITTRGPSAAVAVTCAGPSGERCRLKVALIVIEAIKGKKIVALRANKIQHKAVTLGTKSVTLAAGAKATVKIALNGEGKHLLSLMKRLKVGLTVVDIATRRTVAARTLTFTLAKNGPKRHR